MLGQIRKRDVVAHPMTVIQAYGVRVFVSALLAPPQETFLGVVCREAERERALLAIRDRWAERAQRVVRSGRTGRA